MKIAFFSSTAATGAALSAALLAAGSASAAPFDDEKNAVPALLRGGRQNRGDDRDERGLLPTAPGRSGGGGLLGGTSNGGGGGGGCASCGGGGGGSPLPAGAVTFDQVFAACTPILGALVSTTLSADLDPLRLDAKIAERLHGLDSFGSDCAADATVTYSLGDLTGLGCPCNRVDVDLVDDTAKFEIVALDVDVDVDLAAGDGGAVGVSWGADVVVRVDLVEGLSAAAGLAVEAGASCGGGGGGGDPVLAETLAGVLDCSAPVALVANLSLTGSLASPYTLRGGTVAAVAVGGVEIVVGTGGNGGTGGAVDLDLVGTSGVDLDLDLDAVEGTFDSLFRDALRDACVPDIARALDRVLCNGFSLN